MNPKELIDSAKSIINYRETGECSMGGVGSALETDTGKIFTGVCIDTRCSIGFCAEGNAIGTMVTAGGAKIIRIVAVREKEIIPPCGKCLELIKQLHEENINTQIILSPNESKLLKELLPFRYS